MEVTLTPGVVWDSVEDGGFPSNSRLVFQNISSYGHMCLDTMVEDIHGHSPATSGISINAGFECFFIPASCTPDGDGAVTRLDGS